MTTQLNTGVAFGVNREELLKQVVHSAESFTTLTPSTNKYSRLIQLLQTGASISRDRRINLDYAKVADEAANAITEQASEIAELKAKLEHLKQVLINDRIEWEDFPPTSQLAFADLMKD